MSRRKVTVSTTLELEDVKKLEEIRKKKGEKSISAVIRSIVQLYLWRQSTKEASS